MIHFTVLGKINSSLLKESKEDMYKQVHLLLDAIEVPKHNVHVGPPLDSSFSAGYDFSACSLARVFRRGSD